MKKYIAAAILVLFTCCQILAEPAQDMWTMQDDVSFYKSITVSVDYAAKPVFKPMAYTKHDLFEDIKVTAIESIPFGFLYTFAGLWLTKAIQGKTISPKVGSLLENQQTYYIAIGSFMAVNVVFNIFNFYDYSKNTKTVAVEKVKSNP